MLADLSKILMILFHLDRYEEEIKEMDGFGEKSYQKIMQSVEAARQTTLPKLIYSLGIPGIGLANARVICQAFGDDVEKMIHAEDENIAAIPGNRTGAGKSICRLF